MELDIATLDNGSPFEIIVPGNKPAVDISESSSRSCSTDSENYHRGDVSDELEECIADQSNMIIKPHESLTPDVVELDNSSHHSAQQQSGHFNCLILGVGNNGCQNIDYISEKTNKCSCIKINTGLKGDEAFCKHIKLDGDGMEDGINESLQESLKSQLQEDVEHADIVIVVFSLIDEISEIVPTICTHLNEQGKSNLVILFKPTAHIKSEVDKANIILNQVQEAQKKEDSVKNALVVLSQEKAGMHYEVVNDCWAGLFATVHDITECLDTFLNPHNSSQISLSRVRKMLNCGGPTFYGRITINLHSDNEDLMTLDSLPEDLSEQSFVDDANVLSARNIIAIVKSSDKFSTRAHSQFKTQIGKIANANYDQSSQQQIVHLSHLYDETITEGKMEVIFLATGIKNECEKEVDVSAIEEETIQVPESASSETIEQSPELLAQDALSSSVSVAKSPYQRKQCVLSPNTKIARSRLPRPPSHHNAQHKDESIELLKQQRN